MKASMSSFWVFNASANPTRAMPRISHRSCLNPGEITKKKIAVLLLGIVALAAGSAMAGSKNPVVGGQEMYPIKDILDTPSTLLTTPRS